MSETIGSWVMHEAWDLVKVLTVVDDEGVCCTEVDSEALKYAKGEKGRCG